MPARTLPDADMTTRTQNPHFSVFGSTSPAMLRRRTLSLHDAAESTQPKASVQSHWQSLKV